MSTHTQSSNELCDYKKKMRMPTPIKFGVLLANVKMILEEMEAARQWLVNRRNNHRLTCGREMFETKHIIHWPQGLFYLSIWLYFGHPIALVELANGFWALKAICWVSLERSRVFFKSKIYTTTVKTVHHFVKYFHSMARRYQPILFTLTF